MMAAIIIHINDLEYDKGLLRIFGVVELRIPLERATLTEYFDACYVSI